MADNPFLKPQPDAGPRSVEAYVEWFNQTFTFATARVVTGPNGKRSVDVQMGRRA